MTWRHTSWSDPLIESEEFVGGTRVCLTYPDGNIVIGKLSMEPILRAGNGVAMIRIVTPHSGDTWMNVQDADVQVWESDGFAPSLLTPEGRGALYALLDEALAHGIELQENPEFAATPVDVAVDALIATLYPRPADG